MKNNEWRRRLNELEQRFRTEKPKSYYRIIEAFRELVMTKDFEKLSVAEISAAASISRKTFYEYFKDKNEIVEQIVFIHIIQPMNTMRELSVSFEFPSLTIMSWLYEQFYKDRAFYSRITSFTGQNSFFELMMTYTSDIVYEKFNALQLSEQEKEYSVYFYASSHTMVLTKWINEGMTITPKDMASFYEKWTIPAILNYIDDQK